MGSQILEKVKDFLSYEEEIDDYEEEAFIENNSERNNVTPIDAKRRSVLTLHKPNVFKVIILQPTSVEDAKDAISHLKNNHQVIINLEDVDKDTAQRLVDLISGAMYALEGTVQNISTDIVLFAPMNVDITNNLKQKLFERDIIWSKMKKETSRLD